jgi:hypothetical protein
MATYLDYNATASLNIGAPPLGAPEGMKPSTVNDAMRSMMSAIRNLGDQTLGGSGIYGGVSTGHSLAYIINIVPAVGPLTTGRFFSFTAHTTNAGGATLTITGFPAKAIRKYNNEVLAVGDITAGATYLVEDVGATFSLLNPTIIIPALGAAASRNVGLGASDLPANSNLGSAAYRAVGTASGNVPEIANGSGQFQGAVDAAHKALDNLAGAGVLRTIWSSIAFSFASGIIASFNGMSVSTLGVGHYALTFPNAGGTAYDVEINIDAALSANGISCFVESGSRSATGCQIYTTRGNTSFAVFDPDRISVTIFRIS